MNEKTLNSLSDLRFGMVTREEYEIAKENNIFSKQFDRFKNESFPNIEYTKGEIDKIIKTQSEAEASDDWEDLKSVMQSSDGDILGVLEEFVTDLNIEFKHQYLEKIQYKLYPLVVMLKAYFNRPRPFQVAYYTGQKLFPYTSVSSCNPSYPSGHSLITHFLCKVIAFHNPNNKEDLEDIAGIICRSRMIMGVHYESDILFGQYIVDQLCKTKEIQDIYFNKKNVEKNTKEEINVELDD